MSEPYRFFLPRNAFSPRERARAGDVWRAAQDTAVVASIRAGWPPQRYVDEGAAFIVRSMTMTHARETAYGEALVGHTWVSAMRREMFCTREVRIDGEQGLVARATQAWVHVDREMKPCRANATLANAFVVEQGDASVELPEIVKPIDGTLHAFSFECWQTWMDPLAHVNHPQYVDFCEEAIARVLASRGIAPERIVPVAEHVFFRAGVTQGANVAVNTHVRGVTADGAVVFGHELTADGVLSATATTVRKLYGDDSGEALLSILR